MSENEFHILARMAKLAWRNILLNWRHGLATMLAIATGFMAISLFDGFIRELVDKTFDGYGGKGMLGHLVVQAPGAPDHLMEDPWKYALGKKEQDFLEAHFHQDKDFVRRVRFLSMFGMINAGDKNAIFMGSGYDLQEGALMRGERWAWNATAGKPLDLSPPHSVILGGYLAEMLGCKVPELESYLLPDGNYVPKERPFHCEDGFVTLSASTEAAQVNALRFNIVGTLDAGFREANKRAAQLSLADAQSLLDTDKITMVSVQLKSTEHIPAFIHRLKNAAEQAQVKIEALPWIDHPLASYAKGGLSILDVFRNLFMAIVVFISVMAVMNTMMKSIYERIREIGTLRSIGYLRHHIVFMFACEGLVMSAFACIFGLTATVFTSHLVGWLGITYKAGVLSQPMLLRIAYAPFAWLWSALLLSILATGTAAICARRASRMVIAEAIHHA